MAPSPSPSPRHGHRLYVAALGGPSWRSRCAFVARSLHPLAHEHKPRDGDGDRYVRRKSLLGRVLTAIYRFTLRTCDRVVVMDHWMKSRVEREGVVGPQNIVIVPLWPI